MFMTEESPVKVVSLLGVAMTSMFFLFAVSFSNANFRSTENPFPDPFSPASVMAVLDSVSNSYSNFVYDNLINPATAQMSMVSDNVAYIADNAGPQLMAMTGLSGIQQAQVALTQSSGQVAGAFTQVAANKYYSGEQSSGSGIDLLYSLLIR